MLDFVSQVGAFIGTTVILFIVTQPRKEADMNESPSGESQCFKGAKKYSYEGRRQTSFGLHDDFDM